MKRKDKCKIISYAKNQYNEIFKHDYKYTYKSKKDIELLLKQYPESIMCRWDYCCYGLYNNCWQEPIEDGIWNYTQEDVNNIILDTFTSELLRKCRTEKRMLCYEENNIIHMVVIARDLNDKADYIFAFCKNR